MNGNILGTGAKESFNGRSQLNGSNNGDDQKAPGEMASYGATQGRRATLQELR